MSKAKVAKVPYLCGFWPLFYDFLVSSTAVSTWLDTFWLMSGIVPVRGNISGQNGNMSTPTRTVIHTCKQVQSVAKLTSISRYWPSKSMGTSRYKAFSTYTIQGKFTLLPPAAVSTVETVKTAQLLHNPSALTADWPYTRRELSCRISPSRPGIWSLFYQYHIGHSHH